MKYKVISLILSSVLICGFSLSTVYAGPNDIPEAVIEEISDSETTADGSGQTDVQISENAGDTDTADASEGNADDHVIASESYDSGHSWTLTEDGTLTISGNGSMSYMDSGEESPWEDYHKDIIRIVIEPGITDVMTFAFLNCINLTEVALPETVTILEESAFVGCTSLTSIDIPDSVTQINTGAFASCTSLADIHVPESIIWIGSDAFLDTPWRDKMTDENGFFIANGILLEYRGDKENVIIPNSVTVLGEKAFVECSNLVSVIMSDTVRNAWYAVFYGCSSLKTVQLSSHMETIGNAMFKDCTSLETLTIPESVTYIGSSAFDGCTSLAEVIIPSTVSQIAGHAFDDTPWKELNTDENGMLIVNQILVFAEVVRDEGDETVVIPNGVVQIPTHAFCGGAAGYSTIKEVVVPESVTYIAEEAFWACPNLKKLIVLGKETVLEDSVFWGISGNLVIHSYSGSPAETYAENHNMSFVALEEIGIVPELTDSTYVIGSGEDLVIYCTGELKDLVSVEMDGEVVDPSNYTLEEGSTVLTFTSAYLDTLAPGRHTVRLNYIYGSVDTFILILDNNSTADGSNMGGSSAADQSAGTDNTSGSASGSGAAKTGDSTKAALGFTMLMCSAAACSAVIVFKRKKFI